MGRKTMKDLDEEIVELSNIMNEVKQKLDEVYKKYDDLEAKVINAVKDDDVQGCQKKYKKRPRENKDKGGPFKCEICEREFNEEWKLGAHVKTHSNVKCDMCEESFKYKDLMGKHVKIVHENVKWFCHFYNNNKECPQGVKCIFLHQDSEYCRYKNLCERTYCMFKHETSKCEPQDSDATKETAQGIWEMNDDEVLEVIECVDTSRNMEQTFCNPNQSEKSDLSVETEEKSFKCTPCEYEAMTKHDLKNHEDDKHNWCWVCDKHFETKREFNVHHYSVHSSSRGIWD